MIVGPLFNKLLHCRKKKVVNQGGTSSAKTVTILQALACKCVSEPGIVVTVVGQDIPNLKKGAIRDFQIFVEKDPEIATHILYYNKSDRVVYFKNGSIIEFNAYQNEQDAKSGKRDYLFVNEANGIPYMVYWQLSIRTRKQVFIDYNPTAAFWVHEKLIGQPEVQLYITDHRHNPFLSQEQHDEIENIADPELWKVYARGLTGMIKGLIFGHFKRVQAWPERVDRIIWAIDYGYTNDPTAIVKIGIVGRKRYFQEVCYQPGVSAEQIRDLLLANGYEEGEMIYSETDANMIAQLRMLSLPVYPAIKGPGSIAAGISKVKEFECYYTESSTNIEMEISKYKWVTAQNLATGQEVMTNIPVDVFNHLCDAVRYGVYTDIFHQRMAA